MKRRRLTIMTLMTHRHGGWRLTAMARACAVYLAVILGWAALALVVVTLVALWRAHGVIGVMLLAALVLLVAISVLGSRWARRVEREIMGATEDIRELTAQVEANTETLGKIKSEVAGLKASHEELTVAFEELLASAGNAVDPAAVEGLRAAVAAQGDAINAVDAVIPDVEPEPEPEPEPVDPEFGV